MTWKTLVLRFLLVLLLAVLVLGSVFLHFASLESARNWPNLAHLRLPIYLAVLFGFTPVVAAMISVFEFLGMVDRGDVFTNRTVSVLRRMRLLIGAFAGYFVLGLVGFWAVTNLMHPSLLFVWFVMEVAALFLFTNVALFERIFADALELIPD